MRFRLRQKTGAVSGSSIVYDARFGTDLVTAAATGWFTFGLRPSVCRRVWVNATQADDTGNGLTAATAKKDLMAAWTAFKAGWTPGDQLMIAGTSGRSYTDDGTGNGWQDVPGFSIQYPTAILCYDPAAPADATKYGRLYGAARPRILLPDMASDRGSSAYSIFQNISDNTHNFAVQGLILDAQDLDDQAIGHNNTHHNVCYQNCLFKQTMYGVNNAGSLSGGNQNFNLSKCGFYGMWRAANGNTSGLYYSGYAPADGTGPYLQDNVYYHCGWHVNSHRDDTFANGGPSVFGHAQYYGDNQKYAHFDRLVFIRSSSDGWGLRGTAAATQLVSFFEPLTGGVTGVSGSYTESPLGDVVTVDDFAVFGASDLNSSLDGARMQGIGLNNSTGATAIRNGIWADNPSYPASGGSFLANMTRLSDSQFKPQVAAFDRIRAWNWSSVAFTRAYQAASADNDVVGTWTNSLVDNLTTWHYGGLTGTSSGTLTGTGVRTWTVGDYPSPKTASQMITALGFASEQAMVNAMLDYPHLPWAQAALGIAFPAFGLTAQYATASVPDISGLPAPTVIVSTPIAAPTLSSQSTSSVGTTTVTLNVTTNTNSGYLYWVVSDYASAPLQYDMFQGRAYRNPADGTSIAAAASGRQLISSTGAKTVSVTGLVSAHTYTAYLMHCPGDGNNPSTIVATSSFTTS